MGIEPWVEKVFPFGIHLEHEVLEQGLGCLFSEDAIIDGVQYSLPEGHGREVTGHLDQGTRLANLIIRSSVVLEGAQKP